MSKQRILIIDDEYLTRISLADFLQESGYETATASDAETAFILQGTNPFDVCIVDIRMPGIDGIETILTLHQLTPTTRFLIYTGSPQFTLPPPLENLGISEQHIVRKPVIDMQVFVSLIETMKNEE
jgi:DNA-binding NtrC family response regulator